MKTHLVVLRAVASALDHLEVAMCAFDSKHRAVAWNHTFLALFPEHDGHVHEGEPYSENLRRFYQVRLSAEELPLIEKYVAEGVERHRTQRRPYEFDHRGNRVRVASVEIGLIGRVRFWRQTTPLRVAPPPLNGSTTSALMVSSEAADALECIADGALIVDMQGRILWANAHFRELYGVASNKALFAREFRDVFIAAWSGVEQTEDYHLALTVLAERKYLSGAPYELALPGQRWIRVIEQPAGTADGRAYCSHVDITALKRQHAELRSIQTQLEALATTDGLTGLCNRRSFDAALMSEWRRAPRGTSALTLLMLDVDHFKELNDAHGHTAGDVVLQQTALTLAAKVHRAGDTVARYGGEEFAMLLPHTDAETGVRLAEEIRVAIEEMQAGDDRTGPLRITVSIGVASVDGEGFDQPASSLVEQADHALYEAKHAGRNRVVLHAAAT
jgi:diguanylate cyclase (GGDEF)-like protein